ncbi:MAG: hypothetical protein JNL21_18880 [Myxococcales bacterium]|nr:hypothetical protein [Myxococcales bacterium]
MAYRDDEEAQRGRVAELERELAEAREKIARLEGRFPEQTPREASRLLGVPLMLEREKVLPLEVSEDGFVAIANALEARLPGGTTAQVGRMLTHKKGAYELRVSRLDGGNTRVQLRGDYRAAKLMFLLGSPGLMLITAVLLASVGTVLGPIGTAVGAVMGIVAAVLGFRWLVRRSLVQDQRLLEGLFETAVTLASSHGAKLEPTRIVAQARVSEESAQMETEAAEEAAHRDQAGSPRQASSNPGRFEGSRRIR